jgi:hypothetical protein
MSRPTIKSPCVADRYHGVNERIAEFRTPGGKGGLFRVQEHSDGRVTVELYRCDEGITFVIPDQNA